MPNIKSAKKRVLIGEVRNARNKATQTSEMRQLVEQKAAMGELGFVLRIGIDGFKDINEKFGIGYGDYILSCVADCIVESLNENQHAYHAVADEYMIVDTAGGSTKDGHELYRKIRRALDRLIERNNYEAVYTISGGIVSCQDNDASRYEKILKLSTFALQQAKNGGKNQVYIFSEDDYNRFLRKKNILENVRKSVSEDFKGFEVFFQPLMTAGCLRFR